MKGRPLETKCEVSKEDEKILKEIISDRKISKEIDQRARALVELSKGGTPTIVGKTVGLHRTTVTQVRKRYLEWGLEIALYGNPRSGRPREITDKQEQQIVALACSSPPPGNARWTLLLLVRECKKRKIIETISDERIRQILKNHELKP